MASDLQLLLECPAAPSPTRRRRKPGGNGDMTLTTAATLLFVLLGAGSMAASGAEARPAPTPNLRSWSSPRDRRRSKDGNQGGRIGAPAKEESLYARLDTRPRMASPLAVTTTTPAAIPTPTLDAPEGRIVGGPADVAQAPVVPPSPHAHQRRVPIPIIDATATSAASIPSSTASSPTPIINNARRAAATAATAIDATTTTTFSPIIVAETSLPLLLTQNSDGSWSRSTDGWLIYGRASSDSVFAGGSYVSNNGTADGNQDGSGDMVTFSGSLSSAGAAATPTTSTPSYQVTDVLPKGWGSTSDRSNLYAVPLIVVASVVLACMITGVVVFMIIARAKAKRKALRRKRHEERRRLRDEAKMAAAATTMQTNHSRSSLDRLPNGHRASNEDLTRDRRSRGGTADSGSRGSAGGGGGPGNVFMRRRRRHTGATTIGTAGGRRSTASSLLSLQDEDKAIEQEVDDHLGGRANLGNLGGLFRELHAASRGGSGGAASVGGAPPGPLTFAEDPLLALQRSGSGSRRSLRRDDAGSGLIGVRPRIDGWRNTLRRRRTKGGGDGRVANGQELGPAAVGQGDDDGSSSTAGTGSAAAHATTENDSSTMADTPQMAATGATRGDEDAARSGSGPHGEPSAFPPAYNRPASIRRPDSPGANSINRDYYDPQLPSFPESAAAAAAAAAAAGSSSSGSASASASAALSARASEKRPEQLSYPAPATADQEEAQAVAYGRRYEVEGDGGAGSTSHAMAYDAGSSSLVPAALPLGAHIATDDKHVLERLRVAASDPGLLQPSANLPGDVSEDLGPSAPALDVDDDGFERFETGNNDAWETAPAGGASSSTPSTLPAPPKPLVYTSLSATRQPGGSEPYPRGSAPEADTGDAPLHLLASAPDAPPSIGTAPAGITAMASAPAFDDLEDESAPVPPSAPPMSAEDNDDDDRDRHH